MKDAKDKNGDLDKIVYGVSNILREDVDHCWDRLESEDSPFWRRCFVRAAFAFFEGLTAGLKIEAMVAHKMLQAFLAKGPMERSEGKSIWEDWHEHMEKVRRGANFSAAEILCH